MNPAIVTLDWNKVTLDHVRRACEMYDLGAARPKRTAKSTFLILSGRNYPAKFIRGLAYHLATGIELDPTRDYAGGLETVKFFQRLGLSTSHGSTVVPLGALSVIQPQQPGSQPPPSSFNPMPVVRSERRQEPQKKALAECLCRRFGSVVTEAGFPWLTVPQPDQMDGTIAEIFHGLQLMRGHLKFATFGTALHCDFFVPGERLIIEYDERQHFTVQRAKALELYPLDLTLGFDREDWLATCRTIHAVDPTPPYRDEQRAFYDSLRDILAARNGMRLIRLRYGTFDWTGSGADEQLSALLAGGVASGDLHAVSPTATASPGLSADQIRKVALVSHNYCVPGPSKLYDYSENFRQINKLCDEQGCDTILYALWTWNQTSAVARNHAAIFGGLVNVRRVILEVWQPPENPSHVEVWLREEETPLRVYQRFGTSSESPAKKQEFISDLVQTQAAFCVSGS